MSVSKPATPEHAATPGRAESLASTLQHIGLISERRARLLNAQIEAEEQFTHRVGRLYADGFLDMDDLNVLYEKLRLHASSGFTIRWKSSVGVSPVALRTYQQLGKPNGPNGSWYGVSPIGQGDSAPPSGQSVVYVLFDATDVPCYTGSTMRFRDRVRTHRREGKPVVRWIAYPCPNRSSAYEMETRLLREHMPYVNKRRGA